MSSPSEIALSGVFGAIAGGLSGFLGIGGGAILSPLFVFVLGFEQHRSQGISLAALLPPVGLPAVLAYRKRDIRVGTALTVLLVIGFAFGAYGGAWLAHRVAARELRWLFAAFLAVSSIRTALSISKQQPENATRSLGSPWLGIPIGFLAGLLSGLLGIGGGIVALPLLRRFVHLGRLEAQATTLAMMLAPIGLPAVYVYAQEQGGLPWMLLLAVATGFSVGASLGARAAHRVNVRHATVVYAAFMAFLALAVGLHG